MSEFYNGLEPRAPRGIARHVRATVGGLLLLAAAVAILLAARQAPYDPGVFEFGDRRELSGIVVERPHPLLVVPAGGEWPGTHALVAGGKRGAGDLVAGLDGRAVTVRGSRIHTDGGTMIEVHAVEPLEGDAARRLERTTNERETSLGAMTLVGEIVDSKCHFGVMKPGRGIPHRECAILCIRGGIPPVLRVEDDRGEVVYLLLVGADGRVINDEILDLVAEPVEVSGEVVRSAGLLMLRADPPSIRRLRGQEPAESADGRRVRR